MIASPSEIRLSLSSRGAAFPSYLATLTVVDIARAIRTPCEPPLGLSATPGLSNRNATPHTAKSAGGMSRTAASSHSSQEGEGGGSGGGAGQPGTGPSLSQLGGTPPCQSSSSKPSRSSTCGARPARWPTCARHSTSSVVHVSPIDAARTWPSQSTRVASNATARRGQRSRKDASREPPSRFGWSRPRAALQAASCSSGDSEGEATKSTTETESGLERSALGSAGTLKLSHLRGAHAKSCGGRSLPSPGRGSGSSGTIQPCRSSRCDRSTPSTTGCRPTLHL
mmetsp:Transcript_20137/g.66676  ORF Transcript_20137/g.66676 Transcript_20137/m.66676 type:complete len:282 (-) Transcript_20137:392-1237(-)